MGKVKDEKKFILFIFFINIRKLEIDGESFYIKFLGITKSMVSVDRRLKKKFKIY